MASHIRKINWLLLILVFVSGVALSVGLTWIAVEAGRSKVEHEVEDHLRNHLTAIEAGLRSNLYVLDAVAADFDADKEVSRSEFNAFAASLLRDRGAIQAVEWVPRVPRAERHGYEERARRDGLSERGFTERDAQGRMVAAGNRDVYFPVFYVQPLKSNESEVLYDLGSSKRRFATLAEARDTGRPTATGRIILGQDMGNQYGFVVVRPVYRTAAPPRTVEQRREDLLGFAIAVFRIGDIVQHAMAPLHTLSPEQHMEAYVFDEAAPAGERLLYPKGERVDGPADLRGTIRVERSFDVGGRHWVLVALPTAAFEQAERTPIPWIVLCAGLVATTLLTGLVRTTMQRAADRKAAVRSLQESERLLRSFLDNSPNSAVLKDLDGRYLIANTEFLKDVEADGKDLAGEVSVNLFPNDPERCALVSGHEREVVESRSPVIKERERRHKNGAVSTYIVTKFPILDDAGKVVRIGSIATDITAQKQAERELRKLNRAYRTLSRCNEILVRSQTEDGLAANVCRTIVETGGYGAAVVGIAAADGREAIRAVGQFGRLPQAASALQIPWDDPDCPVVAAVNNRTTRVVTGNTGASTCEAFMAAGGFEAMAAFPLVWADRAIGVLAVFGDAPDAFGKDAVALLEELAGDMAFGIAALRTKADRERAEAETRKLARAVEQSPAVIMVTDTEGTIEYVNPKFVEVTGYGADEAVGANPNLLKSGETTTEDYETLWRTIKGGKEWRGLFHNRRKDGSFFWGETAISPVFDGDGRITHFIGIQEDVTGKLETERRLRHADKMDSLGNLAGGIAHDFNNMLLPIGTLTEMVVKEMEPGSKGRRRLERVLEATQRAQSLAQKILAFGRTDSGDVQTHGISEVTSETANLLKSTLPKSIALDVRIEPDLGVVACDRAQIETVILNLAKNAADAMGTRAGDLRIALERITLSVPLKGVASTLAAGDYARLTMSDTGQGIAPDKLAKIFEPYFTTKARGEGTGLGLAMVKTIILKHGGDVAVESRVGVGTTFRIYLPLHDAGRSPSKGGVGLVSAAAD